MLPQKVEHWSLTTLREKLFKIGAKMVRHGRYVAFQMAEVAVLRRMLGQILARIARCVRRRRRLDPSDGWRRNEDCRRRVP